MAIVYETKRRNKLEKIAKIKILKQNKMLGNIAFSAITHYAQSINWKYPDQMKPIFLIAYREIIRKNALGASGVRVECQNIIPSSYGIQCAERMRMLRKMTTTWSVVLRGAAGKKTDKPNGLFDAHYTVSRVVRVTRAPLLFFLSSFDAGAHQQHA